jgi:hypothetical protein
MNSPEKGVELFLVPFCYISNLVSVSYIKACCLFGCHDPGLCIDEAIVDSWNGPPDDNERGVDALVGIKAPTSAENKFPFRSVSVLSKIRFNVMIRYDH